MNIEIKRINEKNEFPWKTANITYSNPFSETFGATTGPDLPMDSGPGTPRSEESWGPDKTKIKIKKR